MGEVLAVDVLFDERDVLALDKPAGLATTGAADDLRAAVRAGFAVEPGFDGPSFLGRLDRPTSGLVVACLSRAALVALEPPWRAGLIHKDYLVIVHGRMAPSGMIEVPLVDRRHRTDAREAARTGFRTIASTKTHSFVEARLFTGRTHQIRRHMKAVGHAVVFDPRYGDARREADVPDEVRAAGLMLHAWRLTHAGDVPLLPRVLEAPRPARFDLVLRTLGLSPSSSSA